MKSIIVLILCGLFPLFSWSQPSPFLAKINYSYTPVENPDISSILEAQQEISPWNIRYWNASYPNYRWHQQMMKISNEHRGHKNGARVAIMHLAIYDALCEVYRLREKSDLAPPFQKDQRIKLQGKEKSISSFMCEYSAAAGAATTIIGHYFPQQKPYLDSLLDSFKMARLATGLEYAEVIEASLDIGIKTGERYLAYAQDDRTNIPWQGQVPEDDRLWSGKPGPYDPMKAQWKPLTLRRNDQFRPGPPPEDWSADMQELRDFNASHQSSDIAWKWKSIPVWDELLERKIMEYDLNPMEAAFACALFHASRYDATIVAWDGKYHYWGIRPFQFDPDFSPILVDTPNFPGYPAGHTTVAGALEVALTYLFPTDHDEFRKLALECSASRFEGGVHFRTDNEVGLDIGRVAGRYIVEHFERLR